MESPKATTILNEILQKLSKLTKEDELAQGIKEEEDRHPKIEDGVLIGAGAKVLGNIRVGRCSRIAAGSVVLREVPPKSTVAGVPAKVVGEAGCTTPSVTMDQLLGKK